MSDAQQYFEMMEKLKAKAVKKVEASSLDFLTADALVLASQEILILVGVTAVFSLIVFILLSRASSRKRIAKIRKTFFVPPSWFGIASGICAWESLHALTSVVIFVKRATSEAPLGEGFASSDLFNWIIFAADTAVIFGFAVTLAFDIDLGYAVLACLASIGTSFYQTASVTENLALAGYLGLVNVLFALFWCVGIGKGWIKSEMHLAMRELEGMGVSKETTSALASKMGQRKGPKKPMPKRSA
ncbi:membrane-associated protein, putative [Bodo saltans]|uniref:Membrane-associated protein, putative n=1 Tax=Bodo saltans TaxID=75058 RepID=A0A0S4KE44_BODSA|nr:membrane-associated protein, putative [Bodo saltans]|eukprot:CUI12709.1 membrane-associated protein, putative [Bodo saltans]